MSPTLSVTIINVILLTMMITYQCEPDYSKITDNLNKLLQLKTNHIIIIIVAGVISTIHHVNVSIRSKILNRKKNFAICNLIMHNIVYTLTTALGSFICYCKQFSSQVKASKR